MLTFEQRCFLGIWLCALFFSSAHGYESSGSKCKVLPLEDRSFSGVVQYLEENRFDSIECFLHSLPEDIRATRTYAKSSISLQESSLMNPRAIIASPRGELFLTFNGSSDQKGYEEVELMAVNDIDIPSEWRVASIRLVENQLIAVENKGKCANCHGDPIKPIWNNYPDWPMLYGSIEDWMPDPKDPKKEAYQYDEAVKSFRIYPEKIEAAIQDRENFLRFRNYAKDHPRYSALEKASDFSNPVYPYTQGFRSRNLAFRPNNIIGQLLHISQSRIKANVIRQQAFYQNFPLSVIYGLLCHWVAPDPHQRPLLERLHQFYLEEYEVLTGRVLDLSNENRFHMGLLELVGYKEHELSLQFRNQILREANKYIPVSWDGSYSMIDRIGRRLAVEDANPFWVEYAHPTREIRVYSEFEYKYGATDTTPVYFESRFYDENDLQFFLDNEFSYTPTYNRAKQTLYDPFEIQCLEWLPEAAKELTAAPFYSRVDQKNAREEDNEAPLVIQKCTRCHEGEARIGPHFSFRTPQDLPSSTKDYLETHIDEILMERKPVHLGGLRMPLGLPALTEDEVQKLKAWLFAQ